MLSGSMGLMGGLQHVGSLAIADDDANDFKIRAQAMPCVCMSEEVPASNMHAAGSEGCIQGRSCLQLR